MDGDPIDKNTNNFSIRMPWKRWFQKKGKIIFISLLAKWIGDIKTNSA